MNYEVVSFYFHFSDEETETQGRNFPSASQLVWGNFGTPTQVSCALSTVLGCLSPILLAVPKSPGPKDFRVMVGAQVGVLGQNKECRPQYSAIQRAQ